MAINRRHFFLGIYASVLSYTALHWKDYYAMFKKRFGALRPIIIAIRGTSIDARQREMLLRMRPMGALLYGFNIINQVQLKQLTDTLYELLGKDIIIITDQEGGLVQRLQPPVWMHYPGAIDLRMIYAQNPSEGTRATYLTYRLMAEDMRLCGINTNAAPVLDLHYAGTHTKNDYRSFSDTPETTALLGRIACAAMLEGGIVPVIKHMPGQGRAHLDTDLHTTHITASADDLARDWKPFETLSDMPIAMSSAAIFDAIDPTLPAGLSPVAMQFMRNTLGYKGLLMSDDLCMKSFPSNISNATRMAYSAGNDLLLYSFTAEMLFRRNAETALPGPNETTHHRVAEALSFAKSRIIDCDAELLRNELKQLMNDYCINKG